MYYGMFSFVDPRESDLEIICVELWMLKWRRLILSDGVRVIDRVLKIDRIK